MASSVSVYMNSSVMLSWSSSLGPHPYSSLYAVFQPSTSHFSTTSTQYLKPFFRICHLKACPLTLMPLSVLSCWIPVDSIWMVSVYCLLLLAQCILCMQVAIIKSDIYIGTQSENLKYYHELYVHYCTWLCTWFLFCSNIFSCVPIADAEIFWNITFFWK